MSSCTLHAARFGQFLGQVRRHHGQAVGVTHDDVSQVGGHPGANHRHLQVSHMSE
ncbi:hypothetical protein [Pantoea sp. Ap-967]|uniref:hypothetical protein n=1 Tax=Pantoea sp. Ap-967 TaxID=2608362 RepID=UPI00141F421E|nr:hypothetical protein [Pantoea sp. Ap-967]